MKVQWKRDIAKELNWFVNKELNLGRHLTRIDLDSYEFTLFLDEVPDLVDKGIVTISSNRLDDGPARVYYYLDILVWENKWA